MCIVNNIINNNDLHYFRLHTVLHSTMYTTVIFLCFARFINYKYLFIVKYIIIIIYNFEIIIIGLPCLFNNNYNIFTIIKKGYIWFF